MASSMPVFAPRLDAERERELAEVHRGEGNAELLEWCPVCIEHVVALKAGTCPWCDTEVLPDRPAADVIELVPAEPPEEAPKPKIPPRRDRRHNHGKPFTADQVIARIRLWAQVTGEAPAKRDWSVAQMRIAAGAARARAAQHLRVIALYELGDWPADSTVRDHFGSWNAALVAAGFDPRPTGRPPKAGRPPAPPRPTYSDLEALYQEIAALRESPRDQRGRVKERLYELAETAIHLGDSTFVPRAQRGET